MGSNPTLGTNHLNHVQNEPESVAAICGVNADSIRAAARLYATVAIPAFSQIKPLRQPSLAALVIEIAAEPSRHPRT